MGRHLAGDQCGKTTALTFVNEDILMAAEVACPVTPEMRRLEDTAVLNGAWPPEVI